MTPLNSKRLKSILDIQNMFVLSTSIMYSRIGNYDNYRSAECAQCSNTNYK